MGFGILLGIVVPVIAFAIVKAIDKAVIAWKQLPIFIPDDTQMAIAVAFNLIFFRTYMIRRHKDKTGRGILLATFLYAIFYVINFIFLERKQLL